jgi:NTE family protein
MQEIVNKNYQLAKSYIDKITLFKYLTSKEKTNLAYHTHSLKFNKGDVVFKEGDDANSFFIIISGSVKLDIPHKNPIIMKDGESFGENSFKKDQVRSGTAVCEDKVHILAISR